MQGCDATSSKRGEIFGIAGIAGNGQVELAEVRRRHPHGYNSGRVWLNGADVTRAGALARMRAGLRFVPEDRLGMGLDPRTRASFDNVMLRDYREEVPGYGHPGSSGEKDADGRTR